MSHHHIERAESAAELAERLSSAPRVALDCEAAGFHRYSDRLCLVQLTIEDTTWVIDPLGFDPGDLLRPVLEDPSIPVLMHGADFDLRLLKRDLGIRLQGLVDTQVSAALLGEEALGLASLLESRLGVKLSKKYQRADWAQRPLTEGMLDYAAADTRHLPALTDILQGELEEAGRDTWAREEWLALEEVADLEVDDAPSDPVVRIKGARDLTPRQVTALRKALEWRDTIARKKDKAPFRIVGDRPLIDAVALHPRTVDDLLEIKGFPRRLADDQGRRLIQELEAVTRLSEEELVPYPRHIRRGPGRPPPELEELIDRLKAVRNRRAEEIGLPRGTLLSNAVVQAIARAAPSNPEELIAVDGMRRWKAEVVGDRLLEVVQAG